MAPSVLYSHLTPPHTTYARHDDLKGLLDSSKDPAKLDAMRLIVGVTTPTHTSHITYITHISHYTL